MRLLFTENAKQHTGDLIRGATFHQALANDGRQGDHDTDRTGCAPQALRRIFQGEQGALPPGELRDGFDGQGFRLALGKSLDLFKLDDDLDNFFLGAEGRAARFAFTRLCFLFRLGNRIRQSSPGGLVRGKNPDQYRSENQRHEGVELETGDGNNDKDDADQNYEKG